MIVETKKSTLELLKTLPCEKVLLCYTAVYVTHCSAPWRKE